METDKKAQEIETEELLGQLISASLLCSRLTLRMKDRFFVRKVQGKLFALNRVAIRFLAQRGDAEKQSSEYVAQYMGLKNSFLICLDEFVELLEYAMHADVQNRTPLLAVQRSLLALKLKAIIMKTPEWQEPGSRETAPAVAVKSSVQQTVRQSVAREERPSRASRMNESQAKILEFVRSVSDVRTKDVIDEFSVLSERTVKRNLKELVRNGLLQKRAENRAVYYSVTNNSN